MIKPAGIKKPTTEKIEIITISFDDNPELKFRGEIWTSFIASGSNLSNAIILNFPNRVLIFEKDLFSIVNLKEY